MQGRTPQVWGSRLVSEPISFNKAFPLLLLLIAPLETAMGFEEAAARSELMSH